MELNEIQPVATPAKNEIEAVVRLTARTDVHWSLADLKLADLIGTASDREYDL
jgi:hypothetical protein